MITLWVDRRLLACYPADVRREYGGPMIEEFREGWAEARLSGGLARLGFWLHLICDWAERAADPTLKLRVRIWAPPRAACAAGRYPPPPRLSCSAP